MYPACQVLRPPPCCAPGDGLPQRVEYACYAYAYAFVRMNILTCMSTSSFACMAQAFCSKLLSRFAFCSLEPL